MLELFGRCPFDERAYIVVKCWTGAFVMICAYRRDVKRAAMIHPGTHRFFFIVLSHQSETRVASGAHAMRQMLGLVYSCVRFAKASVEFENADLSVVLADLHANAKFQCRRTFVMLMHSNILIEKGESLFVFRI